MGATARKTAEKRATNLTLDATLIQEAKALNLNISRAAENGIAEAVKRERERQWLEENAEAIESYNRYVETHGLPSDRHRPF